MSLKQRQIIGITGYSASGKSILAQALRAEFGMGVFLALETIRESVSLLTDHLLFILSANFFNSESSFFGPSCVDI